MPGTLALPEIAGQALNYRLRESGTADLERTRLATLSSGSGAAKEMRAKGTSLACRITSWLLRQPSLRNADRLKGSAGMERAP